MAIRFIAPNPTATGHIGVTPSMLPQTLSIDRAMFANSATAQKASALTPNAISVPTNMRFMLLAPVNADDLNNSTLRLKVTSAQ